MTETAAGDPCGNRGDFGASDGQARSLPWPAPGPFNPFGDPFGNGPYWPFPTVSAGAIHGLFVETTLAYVRSAKGDYGAGFGEKLGDLAASGLVRPDEFQLIERAADLLRDQDDMMNVLEKMRRLERELLVRGGGPVAKMILSVAVDSVTTNVALRKKKGGDTVRADFDGAVAGATVGATIGGPWGALIGGLIGAVACSVAASMDKEKPA